MKKSALKITYVLIGIFVGVVVTLGVIYGFELFPKKELGFDFATLGVYLGVLVTSVALFFAYKQIKQQTYSQKQNVALNLFKSKLHMYKLFEDCFKEFFECEYIFGNKIFDVIKKTQKNMFGEITMIEISILFNNFIYEDLEKYNQYIDELYKKQSELQIREDKLKSVGFYGGHFKSVIDEIEKNKNIENNEKELKSICCVHQPEQELYESDKFFMKYTEYKDIYSESKRLYKKILVEMKKEMQI